MIFYLDFIVLYYIQIPIINHFTSCLSDGQRHCYQTLRISKKNFIVSRGKHIRKHDTSDSGNDANHLPFCNPYSFDILLSNQQIDNNFRSRFA